MERNIENLTSKSIGNVLLVFEVPYVVLGDTKLLFRILSTDSFTRTPFETNTFF